MSPYGCAICGKNERGHGDTYTRPFGAHHWIRPDDKLVKARMIARMR